MPGSIQSIERAAAILKLLAAAPAPLRLSEISSAVQLSRGTAHGILRTLGDVGFVEQDRITGRYLIGDGLFALGGRPVDPNELRARSMNWADPLAARSGEAVRVVVPEGADARVVHYVFRPDHSSQKADVGALLPGHATALGKVLLAFHPTAAQTLTDDALTPYTSRTIATRARLAAELTQIRRQGWAVSAGEYAMDTAGLAAPLTGVGGLVVGAIGIHGALDRLCDSAGAPRPRLLALVQECSRAVGRELTTPRTQA
ncbi:IclR family transcriptional regulator [Kineosporia rhizophila]|uniref:IclR family transcriptional regulator n=1 Tax=Kineosporia TaxID=49184 RepID=UPI001E2A0906|nr:MULTISPECIES: IclR family transcriptional regulator [Kineosporia]MCE0534208.1 IclR family transcriptional regulator [Kineosporia rhizophila]GLY13754.1 IclR family transcriptional regulator [Kineosporia sp. NBRC 101677]